MGGDPGGHGGHAQFASVQPLSHRGGLAPMAHHSGASLSATPTDIQAPPETVGN